MVAGLDVVAGKEVTQTVDSRPAASACRAATSPARGGAARALADAPPGVDTTLGSFSKARISLASRTRLPWTCL